MPDSDSPGFSSAGVFALVLFAAACVVGWILRPGIPPTDDWAGVFFFLLVIILTEALPIELPRFRGTVSVSFAMCYSSVLLFGPFMGGLLTALGSLRKRELTGEVPVLEVVFNRSQLFLAGASGGVLYFSLIDALPSGTPVLAAGATMVGGLGYFAVNVGSCVYYMALKNKMSFWYLLQADIRWLVPSYLGLLPIAYLNVAVYGAVGKVGVLFFLLPLMVGRYAFRMYSELRDVFVSTISALAAALEARDPHTSGHAERVSHFAVKIAEKMEFSEERQELLQYVSILHDIGKIGIPDEVLRKPGKFTEEERARMQKHSRIGADILGNIKALREGASWVLYHHERYDGDGYPQGLKGEEIPPEARILAVADSFDAMLSQRPYKAALTLEEARAELKRCSGTQFDPEVVEVLLELMEDPDLIPGSFDSVSEAAAAGDVPSEREGRLS